jgi:hypothetical protein
MKTFNLKSYFIILCTMFCFSCGNDDDGVPVENPEASFTVNTTIAVAGEVVSLSDTSSSGSGTINSWNWTFTGATPSSSTEQNPTVTFSSKGEFSVSLTVTASDGGTDNTSQNVLAVEGCAIYDCEKFLVNEQLNIQYGVSSTAHTMNIYMPKGDLRTNKPALLINGGGLFNGSDLTVLEPLAERLASYGFVVATAKYRNTILEEDPNVSDFGTANLMRGMVDSKAAIRFLRANANDYGIDPNQIFAGGWSSGAYNALAHAYWQLEDIDPPALYTYVQQWITDWDGVQNDLNVSSEVVGIVSLGGSIFGATEDFQNDLWITSSDVPMFAVHGTADEETPCGALELETGNWEFGSCIIHQRLLDVGLLSTLYTIEGGAHESPRLPENIDNYIEDLVGFLSGE